LNKQKFNSLLQNYNNIADEDRQGLQELAKSFPYSQVIHTLVAKANHDAKSTNASNSLNRAAMYATDRHILKAVILSGSPPAVVVPKKESKPEQLPVQKEVTSVQINQGKQVHISISKESFSQPAELLRNEIWADLEHLRESKAIYLDWLEKSEEDEVKTKKAPTKKAEIQKDKPATLKKAVSKVVKETKKATAKKASTKKETASTKAKETTEEKTKAIPAKAPVKKAATKPATSKTAEKKPAAKKNEVKKKTEVKSKPVKPALEEQIKIIDTFIDKKPSISSRAVKTVDNDQKDLSVDSTTFGEDLISENLAQILIEQGKNEKAIDIYKKLIWKFPQKKSYFAAQIEALTK
jgi:tetratricopeptide (TPR) repeat protein